MKPRVSAGRLREVLDYSPDTGVFVWKIRMGTHGKIGFVAGHISRKGCLHIAIDRVVFLAHRLAWLHVNGEWPNGEIDHRNLNKLDNRIDNLRVATNQGNSANRRALRNNRLGVKGVGISTVRVRKPQRYRARIRVNNALIHLGYFSTAADASAAYDIAARKHFGEFARSA